MPLSAGEQLRLQQAFAPAKTEMRVDDVDGAEIRFNIYLDRRAIFPAEKTGLCPATLRHGKT